MKEPGKIDRYIQHSEKLEFTIVADVYEYYVDFTIYEIKGYKKVDSGEIPIWGLLLPDGSFSFVESLNEAEPYLHGRVRYSGISDWYFDEQDRVMLQGSSREDLQRWGDVAALCWDWAEKLCPNWTGS